MATSSGLYDGFEKVKSRFKLMNNDMNRLNEIMNDVSPLQVIVQAGVFEGNSLFGSGRFAIRSPPSRLAQYDAVVQVSPARPVIACADRTRGRSAWNNLRCCCATSSVGH